MQLSLRAKLYALIALAFVAGVFGIKMHWMNAGEERLRNKLEAQRRKALEEAKEIRDEVEALDRDTLMRRASRWVRNPSK